MEPGLIYWHIPWHRLQERDQDLKLSLATQRESLRLIEKLPEEERLPCGPCRCGRGGGADGARED